MQITKEDVANEKFITILLKKNIRNLGEIQIEYFSVMSYKCPITMKPPTTRQWRVDSPHRERASQVKFAHFIKGILSNYDNVLLSGQNSPKYSRIKV